MKCEHPRVRSCGSSWRITRPGSCGCHAAVLGAGCHGDHAPQTLGGDKLAWLHLAQRELGLAHRKGMRVPLLPAVVKRRLALRPKTAGIRHHLDAALLRAGIEPETAYALRQSTVRIETR